MNKIFEKVLSYVAVVVVMLLLAGVSYWVEYQKQKDLLDQIHNLEVQLAHATVPLQRDTIRDSIPVVQQRVITVDKTDYKKQIADAELIKDLQLELKQIKQQNDMLLATAGQVPINPKDEGDSIFLYKDAWADFEVNVPARNLKYEVRDSVVTFIATIPKHKFLWWKWGTKGYNVKIVNFNPRSKVLYNRTVRIDK
jgi:hypothetical protein